jgi:hypothetical protein
MTTLSIQKAALTGAVTLLGVQIFVGLDYFEGAALAAKVSMIAAMITLAVLPAFLDHAWRAGSYLIFAALCAAFLAFLAYATPATIGRAGEIKEIKLADAAKAVADLDRIREDHAATQKLVEEANRWQATACKGGVGKDCRAATFVLNQRQASLEKLSGQLDAARPEPPGDVGSKTVAWALSWANVSERTVRQCGLIGFGVGLDVVIWALVAFGVSNRIGGDEPPRRRPVAPRLPSVEPALTREENVIAWIDAYRSNNRGRKPSFTEVRRAFNLPKASASRYRKKALQTV